MWCVLYMLVFNCRRTKLVLHEAGETIVSDLVLHWSSRMNSGPEFAPEHHLRQKSKNISIWNQTSVIGLLSNCVIHLEEVWGGNKSKSRLLQREKGNACDGGGYPEKGKRWIFRVSVDKGCEQYWITVDFSSHSDADVFGTRVSGWVFYASSRDLKPRGGQILKTKLSLCLSSLGPQML